MENNEKKAIGPVIGVLIILAAIIIGSLYLWNKRTEENKQPATDQTTQNLENQGDSDDLAAIESDLNAVSVENLDKESADIEAEFEAESQ